MGWLVSLFTGGVLRQIMEGLTAAYAAKLAAQNDTQRIEADQTIARLEAARDIALAEAGDRWSAVRVGRWLIVVPWGLWWAAIFAVSIINPLFGTAFVIHAIPSDIRDMATILIPAIVVADAGMFIARRRGK